MYSYLIGFSVVYGLALAPIVEWTARKEWYGITKYICLFGGVVGIFLFFSGLEMAFGWENPFADAYLSADEEKQREIEKQLSYTVASTRGKGGIVILIIMVWPYFLMLLGGMVALISFFGFKEPSFLASDSED